MPPQGPYNGSVSLYALVLLLQINPLLSGTNLAVDAGNAPVVRIAVRQGRLTIHTWDRNQVAVESNVTVTARHFGPMAVARSIPAEPTFPAVTIQSLSGPVTIPAETFPLDNVLSAQHDGVIVRATDPGANVDVTVPSGTALVWANVPMGTIALNGYHGGTFVTIVHTGSVQLNDVSGSGYAQVARGPLQVRNSTFDHLRARTAAGNIVFQDCTARQIEVTSVNGSIAYDNGSFVPGLARFETQNGNVALGVAGSGARIDAHSPQGRIFSGFSGNGGVQGTPTDAQAVVGSGGPVVTANSQRGSIYLYDGKLSSHGNLQRAWQPVRRILRRPPRRRRP
jgi:hypothetical protein